MRVWWLPAAVVLSVLPLLLAGYIRDPVYPAGYLPVPTSSTPSYPARYLASRTGYKTSKTGYKASRTGYEATSTTRRPSRSTTTRRLTYERIYWEGDHWRPSSGGDSQWRPSERRPSSSGDRSGRGGQLSYTGHPASVDRAGVVAQDRSDTYHTGNGDVCGDFQTIGLGASAASLLAFLVYILLTNSLTSTVSTTRSFTSTLSNNRSNADGDSAPSWTTRATVTATCAAAQMLERRSAHAEPARHAEMPSGQPTINTSTSSTQSRRVSSELGTRGSGGPLVVGPPVGGPPSVTGRQFGDDCFSEMIGALAGLAGLGALSGFSLSQSAQALLASMMTISALTSSSSTTTTTTTTTSGSNTTTTRRRSLEDDGFSGVERGVGLVRRMASLVLVPGEPSCVRHQLCRLVRRARHSAPPYDTALPLASLPLSWLVSKRTGQPFSDLCWVIPEAMSDRDCGRIQPGCS